MRTCFPRTGMFTVVLTILFSLGWVQVAWDHVEGGQAAGFFTGLQHHWSGLDHILAMIAVGLWGAQLGSPALWLLPSVCSIACLPADWPCEAPAPSSLEWASFSSGEQ